MAPFVADLQPQHSDWDIAGKHEGEGVQQEDEDEEDEEGSLEHNEHMAAHGIDEVGLGRSPANLRGSPRFLPAPMVVHGALWVEGVPVRV